MKNISGIKIANVCNALGAARQSASQQIDSTIGVHLLVKKGDYIGNNTLCMILHHNEMDLGKSFTTSLQNAIETTNEIVEPENILLGVIDCDSL